MSGASGVHLESPNLKGTGDLARRWDPNRRHRGPGPYLPPLMLPGCGGKRDIAAPRVNQASVQGGDKKHLQGRAKPSRESDGHGRRVCKGDRSTSIY